MKKTFKIIFTLYLSMALLNQVSGQQNLEPISDRQLENGIVYEANIRQYSEDGSLKSFTKDIPHLKELGVNILWLMPVYPIGEKNRKEGLGSYYSIQNYHEINPEFGNKDDLKALIETAHAQGIYVILDWVANHTSWDHPWIEEHPEYYKKNEKNELISPFDWTDVVKLDYDNNDLRNAMIGEMQYWIDNFGIDGFRCDMAMQVPTDFWNQATEKLKETKPLYFLMEAEQPDLMAKAFDTEYGWKIHHMMSDIAQGKKKITAIDAILAEDKKVYQADDYKMLFTSNHDENSWNGTSYEKMGEAVEIMTALTYTLRGIPLIYNGQEFDLNKRLKFFTKDLFPHTKGKMWPIYVKLGELKKTIPAFSGAKEAANFIKIENDNPNKIYSFSRQKDDSKIYFIGNFSKKTVKFTIETEGNYTNLMTGDKITLSKGEKITFTPWQYWILEK